ncbi:MAG: pseudaminic acid cytidylyltransferase [Propionicimonas sp.]|nr:pseudaminic acid cytidylyltransferase [Propionicimonas sp.]
MRIAVIPARGGSKRIPRKNIRPFAGRPMIAHSIAAALAADCFDRVVVSTDDAEVADVARQHGAEIPFLRPATLADDHTGTTEVIQHAVRALAADGPFSHVCCIYATAPFLTPDVLRAGLDALTGSGKSYAFSVAAFPSPIQRALRIRPDGAVEPIWPEHRLVRSQDLEPAYHDAGQFYWGTAEAWESAAPIHSPLSVPVVLPAHRVQDIDTPEDWVRAEYLYAALQQAGA